MRQRADKGKPWSEAFMFNPSEFLTDENVLHLSDQEKGIYIIFLSHAWIQGTLPVDDERLASFTSSKCIESIRKVKALFKNIADQKWEDLPPSIQIILEGVNANAMRTHSERNAPPQRLYSERLEEERTKWFEKSQKNARIAIDGWKKKKKQRFRESCERIANAKRTHSERNAKEVRSHTYYPPLTNKINNKEKYKKETSVTESFDSSFPSDFLEEEIPKNQEENTMREVCKEELAESDQIVVRGTKHTKVIEEVFDFWRTERDKPRSELTKGRAQKIRDRLKEYPVERLKSAIRGVKYSKFHMGLTKNGDGTVHDELVLILRNGENVEKFSALDEAEQKIANRIAAQNKAAAEKREKEEKEFREKYNPKEDQLIRDKILGRGGVSNGKGLMSISDFLSIKVEEEKNGQAMSSQKGLNPHEDFPG